LAPNQLTISVEELIDSVNSHVNDAFVLVKCYTVFVFMTETYDINRIIEYPGFNVEAPHGTVDVSDIIIIPVCMHTYVCLVSTGNVAN